MSFCSLFSHSSSLSSLLLSSFLSRGPRTRSPRPLRPLRLPPAPPHPPPAAQLQQTLVGLLNQTSGADTELLYYPIIGFSFSGSWVLRIWYCPCFLFSYVFFFSLFIVSGLRFLFFFPLCLVFSGSLFFFYLLFLDSTASTFSDFMVEFCVSSFAGLRFLLFFSLGLLFSGSIFYCSCSWIRRLPGFQISRLTF